MSSQPTGIRSSASPPIYLNISQSNVYAMQHHQPPPHMLQQLQMHQQQQQQHQQQQQQQQQQHQPQHIQRQQSPQMTAMHNQQKMPMTKQQQQIHHQQHMQQQHQLQQYQQHLQQQHQQLQQQHQQQQHHLVQLQQHQQHLHQQHQQQQQQSQQPPYVASPSLSGSETDISTSNENLSSEQRYVLRHTPRVEPQGQENLPEATSSATENQGRYAPEQRFSSNTSSDSTRYASSNRSISETRNNIFAQVPSSMVGGSPAGQSQPGANVPNASNRNSLKDTNSNRSSMDVSTCSYNTLIIHPDDQMYSSSMNGSRDYSSPSEMVLSAKKDRPRSYGEQSSFGTAKGMQEITEIPDDYLNQSHVLKHLAKEIKIPIQRRRSNTRDSGVVSENPEPVKDPPKYGQWIIEEHNESSNKAKSKSQPDLTKLSESDSDDLEALFKENLLLKQQLHTCIMKVSKTQKLEEEVSNIYCVHEELKQTCERREKLERAARMRLQSDLQRVQELNRVMKDQMDILQSQLLAPSEHQLLIAQLFTQNKDLGAAKERQEIELVAQRATLQEQRNHIGILDTALTNAQHNIRRLEEELRKRQMQIEKLTHLHGVVMQQQHSAAASKQSLGSANKLRAQTLDPYETELSKDSNRSGSSTGSEAKWQIQEKNSQIMRLESEQRQLEEQVIRQNAAKMSTLDKNNQEDRITEAKNDKIRYLEEVHSAQRKVTDLQTHLKVLESKLAEKDTEIRLLQEKKTVCGSSFDSYNSFGLNPLGYNSQASFNASNNSFNTNTNTASSMLLDQTYVNVTSAGGSGGNGSGVCLSSVTQNAGQVPSFASATNGSSYIPTTAQTPNNTSPFAANSSLNLPSTALLPNYSNTSGSGSSSHAYANTPSSYDPSSIISTATEASYDNLVSNSSRQPSMVVDTHHQHHHQHSPSGTGSKQQLDDQLMTKRGLCCFPSLSNKKPNPLLSADQVSVLSTNNSDAFLQKLAQYDQRDRDRLQAGGGDQHQDSSAQSKAEDIVLLEKQGRCSQKMRHSNASSAIPTTTSGNLAQVSHTVGQNMADISNIGGGSSGDAAPQAGTKKLPKIVTTCHPDTGILPPRLKERGSSLPPSALPRPPRSLKPPRKIDYDRLSDVDMKTRSQTPPKLPPSPTTSSSSTVTTISNSSQSQPPPSPKYDQKSLKRNDFGRRDFSPSTKSYMMIPSGGGGSSIDFPKPDFSLKRKDYGSMKSTEFSKPEYTSTKNYHRLEESPKTIRNSSSTTSSPQRSLLPSARNKYSPAAPHTMGHHHPSGPGLTAAKNSRDSLNSSGSNNSSTSIQLPQLHQKTESSISSQNHSSPTHLPPPPSYHHAHSRTPPKYQPNMATMSGAEKTLIAARQQNSQRQLHLQQQHHKQQMQQQFQSALKPPSSGGSMSGGSGSTPNSPTSISPASSLPPKPVDTTKGTRRSGSLSRGENRYRIQF